MNYPEEHTVTCVRHPMVATSERSRTIGCAAFLMTLLFTTTARADAEPFVFAYCQSTGKHVSLRFDKDHYLLHFHVRVSGLAGKSFFARVRTQVGKDENAKVISQSIILLNAQDDSEVWKVKMRVPRFSSSVNQNSAIYQLELGTQDRSAVDEFVVAETFAWKVTRDAEGLGEMVAGPSIGLPMIVRIARIEGSKIVIRSEAVVKAELVNLQYGFSNNIAVGSNNFEQSAERIAP